MASRRTILKVEVREPGGKGGARQLRRDLRVPGVLYGGQGEPVPISMRSNELRKAIRDGGFPTHLHELEHEGEKQPVLARDVQFHPVTEEALHFDLLRVDDDTMVQLDIPVEFRGEDVSPGLKRGGVLNVVQFRVELNCPAGAIPEKLDGDVSAMEIGDVLKISDIPLPSGVEPVIQDRDFTIATIAAPSGMQESQEGSDEETETEEEVEEETTEE